MAWLCLTATTVAHASDITLGSRYWLDPTGKATIQDVSHLPDASLQAFDQYQNFDLTGQALWIQPTLPALDHRQRWFLVMSASAFINSAAIYLPDEEGTWQQQVAGDSVPVSEWTHPDQTPVFMLPASIDSNTRIWLRIANEPAPTSPRFQLLSEKQLQQKRQQTFLWIGAYLGLGALVLYLGVVHWRLYGDRAFMAYCAYVGSMWAFQVSFTGIGGLFFWNESPRWNDMAPPLFMLWLTASGIWFVREVCALSRYSIMLDRLVLVWCAIGLMFPIAYMALYSPLAFRLLNIYGLISVLLSISLCLWTWRQGQPYAGWLFLGFLPVHLGYPFPALRSAGILPDSWATQYAVMIGSAIEIPLLLYILHLRAKDFSENHARMRALESTDLLTGLALLPVLILRLRDALSRARRQGHQFGLFVVDLSNYGDIASTFGRDVADKAMVVAASRLTEIIRDIDTVSRLEQSRFALLIEGPQDADEVRLLAQHIVAKGLENVVINGVSLSLKFRVATAMPPDGVVDMADGHPIDEHRLIARLARAIDRGAGDSRKVVQHLPFAGQIDRTDDPHSSQPAT